MGNLRAATLYVAVWVPIVILAIVVEFVAIMATRVVPAPVWAEAPRAVTIPLAILLNVVPAVVLGFAAYARVVQAADRRWAVTRGWRGHMVRATPLYVIALAITGYIVAGIRQDPSTGLVAQLFVWPALVSLAGAAADLRWSLRRSPDATLAPAA